MLWPQDTYGLACPADSDSQRSGNTTARAELSEAEWVEEQLFAAVGAGDENTVREMLMAWVAEASSLYGFDTNQDGVALRRRLPVRHAWPIYALLLR